MVASLKSGQSGPRRRLLELMQKINFGRIEHFKVSSREPVFSSDTRIFREIKFGAENGARAEASISDFALKLQVVELFAQFDAIGDGVIECLVVKHGLPFSMSVKAAA